MILTGGGGRTNEEKHWLGSGLEEVGLAVHELGTELGHLVLHLSHLSVEPLADVAELGIDHAEVAQFDRDVSLNATVMCHLYAYAFLECCVCVCSTTCARENPTGVGRVAFVDGAYSDLCSAGLGKWWEFRDVLIGKSFRRGNDLWRKLETATRDVRKHNDTMLTYERTLSSRPVRTRVYMSGKSNTHPRP